MSAEPLIPGVSLEHAGSTAVVTFGETAMNRRFVAWLDAVVGWLEKEPSISAVIFTGTRSMFLSGADLTEVRRLKNVAEVEASLRIPHSVMERIFAMEKLTVAAVNGYCIGGGLELALVCDFRIAAEMPAPYLGLPEVRLGLVPALGGAARILGTIGRHEALRMLYSGELITAPRALACGLVDEVVPAGRVLDSALNRCSLVLRNSAAAIRALKRLIVPAPERARFANALHQAAVEFSACCSEADKDDRIDAFRRESRLRFGACAPAAPELPVQDSWPVRTLDECVPQRGAEPFSKEPSC
jgi:enoyl-CoA hydratase